MIIIVMISVFLAQDKSQTREELQFFILEVSPSFNPCKGVAILYLSGDDGVMCFFKVLKGAFNVTAACAFSPFSPGLCSYSDRESNELGILDNASPLGCHDT